MRTMLLLGLATASGCFLPTTDEDDTRGGQHDLTVNWHVKNLDGGAAPCPAGFTKMILAITESNQGSQDWVELGCTGEGSHTSQIYTSGELNYQLDDDGSDGWYVWTYGPVQDIELTITEESETAVAAASFTRRVTLDQDLTVDLELYPAGGVGVLGWTLESSLTGADLVSCEAAGVDTIEYTYRDFDDESAPPVTDSWPCSAIDPDFPVGEGALIPGTVFEIRGIGSGRTRALAPKTYTGTVKALRNGTVVGTREEATMIVEGGNSWITVNDGHVVITDR